MQNEKYLELDAPAAPNGYVAPPTKEDLAYVVHFRKTCQRYQIDFAKADSDERDFVIHMAEKTFLQKRAGFSARYGYQWKRLPRPESA